MPGDRRSTVRFEDVTVAFDGVPAIQDISFEAFEGDTRILLGAAGSGKSVLLKTALGLLRPSRGKVCLFDRDITQMKERGLFGIRSKVGMLFQESALFDSLTIRENVAYPLQNQPAIECPEDEVRSRVKEALQFVDLGDALEKLPSELSGGMRRRAAIARAVVTRPPLILYDSPTAGLDPITAHTIMALIIKERDTSKTTGLIVTHRYQDGNVAANFRYNADNGELEPARNHDGKSDQNTKFMVLRDGRLIFEGTQDELEASGDPYISKFVKRQKQHA